MSLEKTNTSYTGQQIPTMIKNGRITFDSIVQRSYVWDKTRKSNFIGSVLMRYPVGVIYAKATYPNPDKPKERVVSVLDGQQRLTTLALFRTGLFALEGIPTVTMFDSEESLESAKSMVPEGQIDELFSMGMIQITDKDTEDFSYTEDQIGSYILNLNGKKYEDLPEYCKHLFDTFGVAVYIFDNLRKHEEYEMFKRLNAGKPLSIKEKNIANCRDLRTMLEIGEHPIFRYLLTEKAISAKKYVSIIGKTWMMLFDDVDTLSFDSSSLNPALELLVISDEEKEKINRIYDNFVTVFEQINDKKILRKIKKETHFVSLIPYASEVSSLIRLIEKFYQTDDGSASIDESYNAASMGGNSKAANVLARHNALQKVYKELTDDDEE